MPNASSASYPDLIIPSQPQNHPNCHVYQHISPLSKQIFLIIETKKKAQIRKKVVSLLFKHSKQKYTT